MKPRKPIFHYGIYIPMICFIIFSILNIVQGDPGKWVYYILSNLRDGCHACLHGKENGGFHWLEGGYHVSVLG